MFFIISQIVIIHDKPDDNIGDSLSSWISHNEISSKDVYFNDRKLSYYSGFFPYDSSIISYRIFDYLIINPKFHIEVSLKNYHVIKYFPDYSKPKVIIYKRSY